MAIGATLGVASAALTAVVMARSTVLEQPAANALLRTLILLTAVGAALVTWRQRPRSRMGPVMMAIALAFGLTTLQAFAQPWAYTVGRLMLPICGGVLLLYALLVFPSGRLEGRRARWALMATVAATAIPWLAIALSTSPLPTRGVLSRCQGACPSNPLQLLRGSAGFTDAAVLAAAGGQALAACLVALVLLRRLRAVRPAERTALVGAVVPLCAIAAGYVVGFALDLAGVESRAADVSWLYVPLFVLVPLALLLGQLRARMFAGAALRGMLPQLGPHPSAVAVERQMALAFGDPTLRIAYRAAEPDAGGERFLDASGAPLAVSPAADDDTGVTELWDGGERIALLLHDPALDEVPGLMDAAGAAALLTVRNARLSVELRSSVHALHASRSRIAAAVDEARRTLERDLEAGARPRLASVRSRLATAADDARDPALQTLLAELALAAEQAAATLDEAARGIYPRPLVEHGLAVALRAAVTGVSVLFEAQPIGRGPRQCEAAVYFACLEAAQNARKHTPPGTVVTVTLREQAGRLRFSLHDDGGGFDAGADLGGSGLANIRDRIAAVDGDVAVMSDPARGTTTVSGSVPWRSAAALSSQAVAWRTAATEPRR